MFHVDQDGKNSNSKNNSYYENNCGTRERKLKFDVDKLRGCFILLFTFFGIVLPVGVQPGIEANYVFAQVGLNSMDDSIDEDGNVILSDKSKSKIKLKRSGPFFFWQRLFKAEHYNPRRYIKF